MQDPNEDTEWNDILRKKGIIPKKEKEVTEEDIVNMVEATVQEKQNQDGKPLDELTLDELDELEDDEDERVLLEYRQKRIAEMMEQMSKARYGSVLEISGQDYVDEVNKAGEGVWVVLHLYKTGIPLCALLNMHLAELARKYPKTKFIKSISTTCIPNFPDKNLPTIFVYFEGVMKAQYIGAAEFRREDISVEEVEWMVGKTGAIETEIKEDPRPKEKPRDVLFSQLQAEGGANDWF
ncbi:viral IAP-associated factor homolog [Cimex lectularius]|uniref:Phosducin domain-containing protein n=1 Tax=Cimex lectularius TaxID=79782 RepID=A0A8I6S3E8_CIMLE|nr:viral IAP-associated factor homolog [Cimex lectularius]